MKRSNITELVQPGGTGPKAGGPNYLARFMVERTFSQDTTAAGGNATLLADLD